MHPSPREVDDVLPLLRVSRPPGPGGFAGAGASEPLGGELAHVPLTRIRRPQRAASRSFGFERSMGGR